MGANRPLVFVQLNYGEDARTWPERRARGEVRDPSPYGYAYAADDVEFRFSKDRPESCLLSLARKGLKYSLGFDLVHAFNNRAEMSSADVIWTQTEKEHLAIALLKKLGLIRRDLPVIANTVWLWGRLPRAGRVRRALTLWFLRSHSVNTVHAEPGRHIGRQFLGRDVVLLPFGTEPFRDLGAPVSSGRPLVVAPGNDRDRDWTLLGHVARMRPDLDFLILSRRAKARALRSIPNVTVAVAAGMQGVEDAFGGASVVVIPTQSNPHASGATTIMQALTAQRPVVVTRVGGIELYGGDDAFYCREGDATDLSRQIDAAIAVSTDLPRLKAARERVLARGLTEQVHAHRHVLMTRAVLSGTPVPDEVSSTDPRWVTTNAGGAATRSLVAVSSSQDYPVPHTLDGVHGA